MTQDQEKQQSFSFKDISNNKINKYKLPPLSLLEKIKVYQLQSPEQKILNLIFLKKY